MSVVVGTDAGLLELDDDGGDPKVALSDRRVVAVAPVHRAHWALVDGSELVHREGDGWTAVASIAGVAGDERGTCLAVAGDTVYAGTTGAHVIAVRHGVAERLDGFDEMAGRAAWYTPWGGPPDLRSVAAASDGTLYANVHVGGIGRSIDGGATWEPVIDIDVDVHQVVAGADGLVVAACGDGGLALSDDRGDHWHFVVAGLHATYCRAVGLTESTIVVSASTGPSTHRSALYTMPVDGRELRRCDRGIPEWFGANIDSHLVATRGDDVAVAAPGGSVLMSSDGGAHWSVRAEGIPHPSAVAFA